MTEPSRRSPATQAAGGRSLAGARSLARETSRTTRTAGVPTMAPPTTAAAVLANAVSLLSLIAEEDIDTVTVDAPTVAKDGVLKL